MMGDSDAFYRIVLPRLSLIFLGTKKAFRLEGFASTAGYGFYPARKSPNHGSAVVGRGLIAKRSDVILDTLNFAFILREV